MPELSVVSVLYNSAEVIEGCLAALPPDVEVVLIDNASDDDGAARAARIRQDARIIRSERNLGFGGGCNLGWRAADGEFVAFVNPDVRLEPGALETLVKRLAGQQHAIVGPAMLDESGRPRRCKRRARVAHDVVALLPSSARWAPRGWDGRVEEADPLHQQGGVVSAVEGACFVIRRADLEAIGGFDEDLFLYDEEESLALRLAALGGQAVYEPAAKVVHHGGASTELIGAGALRHMYRSRVLLYRKRDGNRRGLVAAAALACAALASLPAAAINSVLDRPRALRVGQVWNVLRGIAAGATYVPRARLDYRASRPRN